jgi:hypothetical protein
MPTDLSNGEINDRLSFAKAELYRLIKDYYGDQPAQYEMADLLLRRGEKALRVRQTDKPSDNRTPANFVEAIVRDDGTRPSFFIRDGTVDLASSPAGEWRADLNDRKEQLDLIFPRVGRIDDPDTPQGFCGTGFLVHKNYMITNRHVLQLMASRDTNGTWHFNDKIFVDFSHEFRSNGRSIKRELLNVVFAGDKPIASRGEIDHTKLDLALIELEAANATNTPPGEILLDISPDWSQPDATIYLIGYPGSPQQGVDSLTILERLFQMQFGYKRLAPGKVVSNADGLPAWTFSHDVTTLGGNSGSLAIQPGREKNSVGLHYGGRSSLTRVNWGHVLGATLESTDGRSPKSLKELLEGLGVGFIDRTITP